MVSVKKDIENVRNHEFYAYSRKIPKSSPDTDAPEITRQSPHINTFVEHLDHRAVSQFINI